MPQSIITITPFFIILAIGLYILLIMWRSRLRKITQPLEILHKMVPVDTGEIRMDVWVSNDQERRRWMKLTPSDKLGFLVIKPQHIILYTMDQFNNHQICRFNRRTLQAEWLGNQFLGDANMNWFALNDGTSRICISAYAGMNAWLSRRQTRKIYRNIVDHYSSSLSGTEEFALEKNIGSLTVMILMALLCLYALVDGFFLNPLELSGRFRDYYFLLFGLPLGGLVSFAATLFVLRRSRVPAQESIVLAFLLGITIAMAAIPGAKRLDTALAQTPMQDYEYRMVREGIFQAVDKNPPELDLRVKCDYWKQFKKESESEREQRHFFLLQHGGLGLWQFDGRALDAGIEAYLKEHPEQRRR